MEKISYSDLVEQDKIRIATIDIDNTDQKKLLEILLRTKNE